MNLSISNIFESVGDYWLLMKRAFRKPEKWGIFFKQFITESDKLIIGSIPIVALISLFIGAVVVIQTDKNMNNPLIDKMYIGYMARETLVLEFCSTMVALILTGKMGSNIASELGSMRITEQIDAMEIMGINSAGYLIAPKIVSATILSPLIMLMSFIVGLFGGAMVVAILGMISMSQYVTGLQYSFNPWYVSYSMIKMSVFCFIITSVCSYFGYYAKGGSQGVGRSSTKAIVMSCALILVFNYLLTNLLL